MQVYWNIQFETVLIIANVIQVYFVCLYSCYKQTFPISFLKNKLTCVVCLYSCYKQTFPISFLKNKLTWSLPFNGLSNSLLLNIFK